MGAKKQLQFHKHFRNKSLSVILFMTSFAVLIAGLTTVLLGSCKISLIIIILCFIATKLSKGISGILSIRYLGNFANEKILTQIYAVNAMSRNGFRAIFAFLGSYLLRITSTSHSMILVGTFFIILIWGLIQYMKPRLGLNPKEYVTVQVVENRNR